MNIKRAGLMAVLVVAIAALALPLAGLRAGAAGGSVGSAGRSKASGGVKTAAATAVPQQEVGEPAAREVGQAARSRGDNEMLRALGITRGKADASARIGKALASRRGQGASGDVTIQSGQPLVMNAASALSAAMLITIGGRDNQFSEVALIADWDGREDCVADREQKVDDFSFAEIEIDVSLLRTGISEHTVANGFLNNVYYYGDSAGNFWVATDLAPGVNPTSAGAADVVQQVNIPELVNTGTTAGGAVVLLNPLAGDCTDDQVAITGIAVNPVSDLGDFGLCDTIGEVVYVSVFDSEGCSANAAGQIFRTRIFAFGFTDTAGPFGGLTPVGAIQIVRNAFGNVAGVAVDDDSNLYFQLADLREGGAGGAIFKVTEGPRTVAGCAVNPRVNRVIASVPSGLSGGIGLATALGTAAAPVLTAGGFRLTNYGGGPAAVFGNTVAIDAGPCNVLYAAVAASFTGGDGVTEGAFTNPAALGNTPAMIISFADCGGAFDLCTAAAPGNPPNLGGVGTIPIPDGFADGPAAGVARVAGVNNFRVFVLGNGPDIRPAAGQTSQIVTSTTLKVDMFIDFTLHSGLNVNEEGTVFVISGGTPAGIGKNPSPMRGEVLCFEDMCPMDRRADFVDLRGNAVPNPPASGGNIGDGDSDRFDHIFYQAPLDAVTLTPGGLAGLSRGFLRYTNRLAITAIAAGDTLGVTGGTTTLGDDDTTASCVIFETFDPGHQVAGGDDQNTPFRGDDNDGAGNPVLVGALSGGFEFLFGGPVGTAACVWNCFFWNSNGNITFGVGDTANFPQVTTFRSGPPRIAPAWSDLNPAARATDPINFPAMALGFANVNAFRIRWLNVPEFGNEDCSTTALGLGGNTFSITLWDDGTGIDENASQPLNPANPIGNNAVPFDLQEGPTDLRFTVEPTTGLLIGCPPRREGTGHFQFEFCRMELLGTAASPVITGFSVGGLLISNPPGLCEINLSEAARAADTNPFGVVQSQTAAFCNCLLGEGTEPTLFELFNEGEDAGLGSGGEIFLATPDFDLRFEGNDAAACTPVRQTDLNRGKITFFGVACLPPPNPICQLVTPVGTVLVAPGQPAVGSAAAGTPGTGPSGSRAASPTAGIINAVCAVQLNIVGCGFFPNETTIVCAGFTSETGLPLQRPGKTVSTAVTLTCDTDGNGVADAVIALTNVTPVNCNLLRATISPPGVSAGVSLPGSGFPSTCCGGIATLLVTTTFTAGDNNIFGPFTRSTVCTIDLGVRAPVVFSVTPSDGNCAVLQNLIVTGACFLVPAGVGNPTLVPNVTSVFAVQSGAPGNVIQALAFKILGPNILDAEFVFTTANAGRRFFIFVSGPNGTSRNLLTPPACAAGAAGLAGNEQGIQVTFTCNATTTPGGGGQPTDIAVVTRCALERSETGVFSLDIFGNNFRQGAAVTIGGRVPKKSPKFKDVVAGTGAFSRIRIKKPCSLIPGVILVTNPGQPASQPVTCSATCPTS